MRLISADDLRKATDGIPQGESIASAYDQLNVEEGAIEEFVGSAVFDLEGQPVRLPALPLIMGIAIGIFAERRRAAK